MSLAKCDNTPCTSTIETETEITESSTAEEVRAFVKELQAAKWNVVAYPINKMIFLYCPRDHTKAENDG